MSTHHTRSCPSCGLRFPAPAGSDLGETCPRCAAPTTLGEPSFTTPPAPAPVHVAGVPVCALLDNVRSLSNVGSIFRTADGVGAEHLYLCGITPTPAHPKLAKTALGAERHVPWSSHPSALDGADATESAGFELWALEGDGAPLFTAPAPGGPVCLVLGHEVAGVDPRLAARCTRRVHLPMAGHKGSLNVGVAFAVAAYVLRHGLVAPPPP